jgi:UDP-N-acetylmuramoyl-L-alanyl-D-glutamate--2,6-diaminopimelate ligase
MKLSLLTKVLESPEIKGNTDIEIKGIAYDSRKCDEDFLFVALRGSNFDGHNFIAAAIKTGAKAVLCETIPDEDSFDGITFIAVNDTRKALAAISHKYYDEPTKKLKVIGITGTNGKTTTTYLLKSILDTAGENTAIIGTTGIMINNELIPPTHTTPESLELCSLFDNMINNGVTTVIMEVSSHALAQERVAGIDFDAAVFTNLTPDHLDYHADMFEYATAKKKLFDMLPSGAPAIVFDNGEFAEYVVRDSKANVFFVGRNESNDIRLTKEELALGKSVFTLEFAVNDEMRHIEIETVLSGSFNIENAALAAAYALVTGIDNTIIQKALSIAGGAPGRMQPVKLKNGALALVDYAHTPDALEKALEACRRILEDDKNHGNLICVFGCGGDRDKTKRPIMGNISAHIADFSIITSDNPRSEEPDKIIEEIYGGIEAEHKHKVLNITNRAEAIAYAVNFTKQNDILLVAGKGHEKYQIIGTEKIHFDDAEEINKYNK